ncbi:hypothetical protein OTU49_002974 [Cherax quadricarinatus]|uniref:Uncharacterized protein n=1 Tax=Cherax quadricarinatus TaxID=27406 RepID=A0AAW0XMW0_CHEQU
MADKIASSLKNLFKDDKKNQQKQRGVPANKDELIHWRTTNEFSKLPPRGQEAFFKYLRKGCYSEDKDIIDVDVTAEGMNNSSRRYQFWLKCQGINLTDLFVIYVDDDETKLPDVNTCFTTFKSKNNDKNIKQSEFLKEKVSDAKKVDGFISELKDSMKPDLDQSFTDFKTYLDTTYGKNGEKL